MGVRFEGLNAIIVSMVATSGIVTLALIISIFVVGLQDDISTKYVYSSNQICSQIGSYVADDILTSHAVDVAVAVAVCLSFNNPEHVSLLSGGIGTLTNLRTKQPTISYNFLPEFYGNKTGYPIPAMVNGLKDIHALSGTVKWRNLINYSVDLVKKSKCCDDKFKASEGTSFEQVWRMVAEYDKNYLNQVAPGGSKPLIQTIYPDGETSFAADKVNPRDAELIRSTAINMTTSKYLGAETFVESSLGPTAGIETIQLLSMLEKEDFEFSEKYLRYGMLSRNLHITEEDDLKKDIRNEERSNHAKLQEIDNSIFQYMTSSSVIQDMKEDQETDLIKLKYNPLTIKSTTVIVRGKMVNLMFSSGNGGRQSKIEHLYMPSFQTNRETFEVGSNGDNRPFLPVSPLIFRPKCGYCGETGAVVLNSDKGEKQLIPYLASVQAFSNLASGQVQNYLAVGEQFEILTTESANRVQGLGDVKKVEEFSTAPAISVFRNGERWAGKVQGRPNEEQNFQISK